MTKRSALWSAAMLAILLSACQRDPSVLKQRFLESGDAFVAAGKYAEAAIEYRNALEKDPRAGDVREKLGEVFLQTGSFASALRE
jgi:hypothetical protein